MWLFLFDETALYILEFDVITEHRHHGVPLGILAVSKYFYFFPLVKDMLYVC